VTTEEAERRVPTPQEQSVLAGRVTTGEAAAEEEFARLYQPRVLCLMRARVRDAEAARELANDAIMAALKALRAGRVTHCDRLSAFVCGTARNLANNFLRTRSRQPRVQPLEPEMAAADAVAEQEDAERLELVRREIGRLDPTDRSVLEMTLLQGLEPREIATRLGLSAEVVRARKSRAIRKVINSVGVPSRMAWPEPL
jgi:RNA polymerase sigma factor (sigma-70 family)